MKKFVWNLLLVFLAVASIFGCQAHKAGLVNPAYQPQDLNGPLQAGDFVQKVDNFFVVLDSSGCGCRRRSRSPRRRDPRS